MNFLDSLRAQLDNTESLLVEPIGLKTSDHFSGNNNS